MRPIPSSQAGRRRSAGGTVRVAIGPVIGAAVAVLVALGCEWEPHDAKLKPNEPPTVRITGGTANGETTDYRVEFYWFGSDADGTISHFEYAIDDTCLCEGTRTIRARGRDGALVSVDDVVCIQDADSCRALGLDPVQEAADSLWKRVETYSGQFVMSAAEEIAGTTSPPLASEWHRFFIRAIDNRGGVSRPDSRSFNAVTIAPTAQLVTPVGEGLERFTTLGSFLTTRWKGRDDDSTDPNDKPIGYQMKLVPIDSVFDDNALVIRYFTHFLIARENLLIPNEQVVSEPDAVTDSTYLATDWWPKAGEPYPFEQLQLRSVPPGEYAFAIRAVDEAGAISPDRELVVTTTGVEGNVVKFQSDPSYPSTPTLTVTEKSFLGSSTFVSRGLTWRVEVPANVPLKFEWTASAASYGSEVSDLNYALDIEDPECEVCQSDDGRGGWIGWGNHDRVVGDIMFTDDQAGEQHVLYIRARDETHDPSHTVVATIVMDVVAFSFDRTALWVDDYKVAGVRDCEHDVFVGNMLEYAIDPYRELGEPLYRFDAHVFAGECAESDAVSEITLSELSRYKLLFWNVAAAGGPNPSLLGHVTDPEPGAPQGKFLSLYVRAGGGLVVWGTTTIGSLLGDLYPADPYTPELPQFPSPNFGPGTFLWDVMQMRTQFDRIGRAGPPSLRTQCSGIVGMEPTEKAIALGLPWRFDPTGYDPERRGLWTNRWMGARNRFGDVGATPMTGSPPLLRAGLDTLYTFIPNAWAYEQSDSVTQVCGTTFGSSLDREPVVTRFRSFGEPQGRVVWIGTQLWTFRNRHTEDLQDFMRKMTGWTLGRSP